MQYKLKFDRLYVSIQINLSLNMYRYICNVEWNDASAGASGFGCANNTNSCQERNEANNSNKCAAESPKVEGEETVK